MHPIVEKIIFAAIPILFTCVVYLLSDLHAMKAKMAEIESSAALARAEMNKKEVEQLTQAALARAEIDKRVAILELIIKENYLKK